VSEFFAARYLQGSVIDGMEAPDITAAGLARLGFGRDALARTLRAGSGPQGVMNFAMYDVVHNSTRHLTEPDAAAMAGYLAGARTPLPSPVPHASDPGPDGRRVYVTMCSGCHGLDGEGVPHTAPPMRGNAELRYATAHNLLAIIIDGLPERPLPEGEHFQAMPGYAALLDDRAIADVSNYLRAVWGGAAADVTTQQVAEIRRSMR